MNDIPVHIFINIVEEAGAIRQLIENINEELVATYIGPNGEGPVSVFMNDEDISPQTEKEIYVNSDWGI